jgi:signal transduction histidine kinase
VVVLTQEELAGLENIFAEPLTAALWASTIPQVEALASGITKLPIVTGIEIINEDSGLQVTKFVTRKSRLFHRFQLFYTFGENSVYMATVTVYSDSSVVYNRLKVGLLLLLTQMMTLSVVLTGLFIWVIRKFLEIPLEHFIDEIKSVTARKKEGEPFDLNFTVEYAEFEPLVDVLKSMGEKITEQFQSIQKVVGDLQGLAGRLLSVQEEERKRLARELHDDLAQRLALLVIEVGMVKCERCSDEDATILQNLQDKLIDLSEDIHRISRQLHPSIIEDLGLVDALRSEINNFSRLEEIPVKFEPEIGSVVPPLDIAVSLFRVTQESLRNIKKHAHAKNVTIKLVQEDGSLLLTISDDGRGFDPDIVKNQPGLGLKSMRERMRLIGGSISYIPRQDQGTTVEARVDISSY